MGYQTRKRNYKSRREKLLSHFRNIRLIILFALIALIVLLIMNGNNLYYLVKTWFI